MKKVEFEVVFICQKNSAVEVKSAKIVFLFLQRQRLTFCSRTQEKGSNEKEILCWIVGITETVKRCTLPLTPWPGDGLQNAFRPFYKHHVPHEGHNG